MCFSKNVFWCNGEVQFNLQIFLPTLICLIILSFPIYLTCSKFLRSPFGLSFLIHWPINCFSNSTIFNYSGIIVGFIVSYCSSLALLSSLFFQNNYKNISLNLYINLSGMFVWITLNLQNNLGRIVFFINMQSFHWGIWTLSPFKSSFISL